MGSCCHCHLEGAVPNLRRTWRFHISARHNREVVKKDRGSWRSSIGANHACKLSLDVVSPKVGLWELDTCSDLRTSIPAAQTIAKDMRRKICSLSKGRDGS